MNATQTAPGKVLTTRLSPELLDDLDRLKAHYGIKSAASLIRFLVRQQARRLGDTRPARVGPQPED